MVKASGGTTMTMSMSKGDGQKEKTHRMRQIANGFVVSVETYNYKTGRYQSEETFYATKEEAMKAVDF